MKTLVSLRAFGGAALFAGGLLFVSVQAKAAAPDLILFNGAVFTSDPARPRAEAIAIRGERIIAVGANEAITKLAGRKTKSIDLQGRVVVPGFNDAHYHFMPKFPAHSLKLAFPEPTWTEVLAAVTDAVKQAAPGTLIYGEVGGLVVTDPNATRAALDHAAPQHPVFLSAWFGHGQIFNSAALRRFGIGDEEPDPLGGWFEREAGSRRINGKVFEYAAAPAFRRLADSVPDAEVLQSLRAMSDEAVRYGITSIQDMSNLPAKRYVRLLREAQLPIRVRVIRLPLTRTNGWNLSEEAGLPRHPRGAPRVTVSGTKWLLDGTPIERGMATRAAYLDRPDWFGTLSFPETEVRAMLREAVGRRDPVLFHAVGDRAVVSVLDAMEAVDPRGNWPKRRVRIEHGDGVLPDLFARARKLGVVVVQNPTHYDPAAAHHAERFGTNHLFLTQRSLLDAGIPLAFGSDGPMNPGLNLMFAVTHSSRPIEAITREQAVLAYTRGAAYAEFEETEKGTLAPGQLADLAVLSQDIFTVPPDALPATKSVLTMVGGKVVFDGGIVRSAGSKSPCPCPAGTTLAR
jgi:predicted amidohydrolase YtcJ